MWFGYCVLLIKEAAHMNDYMKALHQRFFRDPDHTELEEDIEKTRQEVRDCLDKMERRKLMHLVDTQNLLRKEISLASFTAGFKLACGMTKELEAEVCTPSTGRRRSASADRRNRRNEVMAKRRPSGDGMVRKREDGRWEGRCVVGYDEKGLPKTKNVLDKTKRECQEKLKQLMKTVVSPKSEQSRPDMPFGEWLDFWYRNCSKPKLRPTTQACYEGRIYQHIIPELGKIPLNQLTQKDLQQFYARLKKGGRLIRTENFGEGLSDSMVWGCHATCRAALDKAVQEGLVRTNPAVGCKLPPKRGREMQVLRREELQRFLIQAQAEGYYELFLLDLCTGLRRGELIALQWDDLDFETGTLTVNKQVCKAKGQLRVSTPKTKASIRKLMLQPAVVDILKEYRKNVDSRWIFPSPVKEDTPLSPGVARRRLQQILERAGCKKVRFHDLRHTFATLALENGMDIKNLSAMLGHVSAATTLDIYTHITGEMQSEAAAKIDRGLGNEVQEDTAQPEPPWMTDFRPVLGQNRKPGTGCITEINDYLFEGRYSPV